MVGKNEESECPTESSADSAEENSTVRLDGEIIDGGEKKWISAKHRI